MSIDHATKRAPARNRVLQVLADCQWHNWRELKDAGGIRFGARLRELKRLGYSVESEPLSDGQGNRYRIPNLHTGQPEQKRVKVLLLEDDARELQRGRVTMFAQRAIRDALASFEHNKGKL